MALNTLIETIKSKDLVRQNRFSIHIQGPHGVDRDVNMLAESVSMPGQNILSVPDDLRFGPQREQAQGYTYGPISFTFLCTPGMPEKVYFEDWQDLVVNKNADQWTANYYRDYIGEIIINQLDRSDSTNYTVEIHEAYPKTVNAQEFSLGSNDAYQTITVEIAYRWWERVESKPAVANNRFGIPKASKRSPAASRPLPGTAGNRGDGGPGGGSGSGAGSGETSNPGTIPNTVGTPF